jgi:hypothetical protein
MFFYLAPTIYATSSREPTFQIALIEALIVAHPKARRLCNQIVALLVWFG